MVSEKGPLLNIGQNWCCSILSFIRKFHCICDGTGSFKTVNLEVFKLKKEKLFVLISITWYTDTLIPKVSYEPDFVGTQNLNLKVFKF